MLQAQVLRVGSKDDRAVPKPKISRSVPDAIHSISTIIVPFEPSET